LYYRPSSPENLRGQTAKLGSAKPVIRRGPSIPFAHTCEDPVNSGKREMTAGRGLVETY